MRKYSGDGGSLRGECWEGIMLREEAVSLLRRSWCAPVVLSARNNIGDSFTSSRPGMKYCAGLGTYKFGFSIYVEVKKYS